ncbi:MAG: hypothetical protein KDD55_07080, partial [Bdellovibrionales bacterium]|nr:hypothetical protein [Bdellovibrionales bacterium]
LVQENEIAEYNEMQVGEWREVNARLLRQLSSALELSHSRQLVSSIYRIRDQFYSQWRECQGSVHEKHRALSLAVENGDFIKCVLLGKELVALKARLQATQAAHHELQSVIEKSNARPPKDEPDPPMEEEGGEGPLFSQAKIIPMRRRS